MRGLCDKPFRKKLRLSHISLCIGLVIHLIHLLCQDIRRGRIQKQRILAQRNLCVLRHFRLPVPNYTVRPYVQILLNRLDIVRPAMRSLITIFPRRDGSQHSGKETGTVLTVRHTIRVGNKSALHVTVKGLPEVHGNVKGVGISTLKIVQSATVARLNAFPPLSESNPNAPNIGNM